MESIISKSYLIYTDTVLNHPPHETHFNPNLCISTAN